MRIFISCSIQFQQSLNSKPLEEAYVHVLQISQTRGGAARRQGHHNQQLLSHIQRISGASGWGLKLRIRLHLTPRLRISGDVPPPPTAHASIRCTDIDNIQILRMLYNEHSKPSISRIFSLKITSQTLTKYRNTKTNRPMLYKAIKLIFVEINIS